jgi:hypothetical protein
LSPLEITVDYLIRRVDLRADTPLVTVFGYPSPFGTAPDGTPFDDALRARIVAKLRADCSPRTPT